MEKLGIITGVLGIVTPGVFLLVRRFVEPTNRMVSHTELAYGAFFIVGIASAVFALIAFWVGLSSGHPLGLAMFWVIVAYPFFAALYAIVLYGIYHALLGRRDLEFVAIAIHSAATYLVSCILIWRYGGTLPWLYTYLVVVALYPFTCIGLTFKKRRKFIAKRVGR